MDRPVKRDTEGRLLRYPALHTPEEPSYSSWWLVAMCGALAALAYFGLMRVT